MTDLIPLIERTYRVLPGREDWVMAGLMGGMQTFLSRTWTNSPTFSGSTGGRGGTFDPKTSNNGAFRDPGCFNTKVKVLFLGIGSAEGTGATNSSNALTEAGIKNIFFESSGTAHGWLTWRRCLIDFATPVVPVGD